MKQEEPSSGAAEVAVDTATRRGTPVVIAGHLASQLIGIGTMSVLCHLLEPEDYGLLAEVLPAVMLPRMAATLGPGMTVLQRRDLSHEQLSVLFWLQVFVGVAATFLSIGICWLQAWNYHQPMLFPVGVALASGTLFAAIGNQHQAMLERELRFGTASLLRLVAQLIACTAAISCAVWRHDVWALVLQQVFELFALVIGSWLLMSWRPSWPARPWQVRELISFSAAYSASSLVHFLSQNIEKILLPVFFGEAGNRALGLYSQAFWLMIKPVYLLTTPLTGVMVSSLAKAPIGSELYTQLTVKFFRASALGLFPCAIGLALVSDEVMLVLGGEEWRDGSGLLRWLAPSIITIGLQNLAIFVLASRGMGRALLISSIWLLLLILQGAAFGMYAGQIWSPANEEPALRASFGLAVAFTLVQFFVWGGPFLWFALRSVGVSPVAIAWKIWPAARAAALMGLLVYGVKLLLDASDVESSAVRLLLLVLTGVAGYGLIAARELRNVFASLKS
jgi:O-antigen/teichoic acid export membrane protein